MADWSAFLDKFLRDTELLVLAGAGSISHDEAMTGTNEQYDAFAERRRLEAEAMAEARGANAIAMGVAIFCGRGKGSGCADGIAAAGAARATIFEKKDGHTHCYWPGLGRWRRRV